MEAYSSHQKEIKANKRNKKCNLDNIIQEYCLKRNKFDPDKGSPDMFSKKLQHRMKLYYNTLYKFSNSPNKY